MALDHGRPPDGGISADAARRHNLHEFHVGDRVSRKDGSERGTVIEADGQTKVKWDGGRTSYFRHNSRADVERM